MRLVHIVIIIICVFCGKSNAVNEADDSTGAIFKINPIAEVKIDAKGAPLRFPYALAFDKQFNEIYLATGGKQQVIVYANDMFPLASFASGRDVYTPQGIAVDSDGMIYVCQAEKDGRPNRITVLNGAFIIDQEFSLDEIPEVKNFVPRRIAVSSKGLLYVASMHRGVLVFEKDGTFLRWLKAEDLLSRVPAELMEEEDNQVANPEDLTDEQNQKISEPEIPEEFRPLRDTGAGPGIYPVLIRGVNIDSEGKIYLISSETGKVYVFSPEEKFLYSFGEKGGSPGKLSQPRSVAVDTDRELYYVVDYMRHSILAYDKKGIFKFEFGGKGEGLGWFKFPTDIILNQFGQVVVADLFNHRLQVIDVQYQAQYPTLEEIQKSSSPPGENLDQGNLPVSEPGKIEVGTGESGITAESSTSTDLDFGSDSKTDSVPETEVETQPEVEIKETVIPADDVLGFPNDSSEDGK